MRVFRLERRMAQIRRALAANGNSRARAEIFALPDESPIRTNLRLPFLACRARALRRRNRFRPNETFLKKIDKGSAIGAFRSRISKTILDIPIATSCDY